MCSLVDNMMVKHDTSRARLLIAMQEFDVYHRGKSTKLGNFEEKDPWPNANYSGLIFHKGRYYPPKVIVHLANPNFDRSKDQTQMAVRILEKHDFQYIHFEERGNTPEKCCWDGFPESREFESSLPLSGDAFWDFLIERADGPDNGSIFEFNGNRRKIGGLRREGSQITIYRPPKSGNEEWSDTPSTVDRGATIKGYEELLGSEGVVSGDIFSAVSIQNQAIVYLCRDLLEWTEEGKISITLVGPKTLQLKPSQPSYYANWGPTFPEKFSPENADWVKENDNDGESKLANFTNVMGVMLQSAWLKQNDSKFEPIEFKKSNKGDELLPTDCHSRLNTHQLHQATSIGVTWQFKRYVRITRSSTEAVNNEQFFLNAYFPGYQSGKLPDGKPRKTNVTIEPKLEPTEIAFTAGLVIPENSSNEEKSILDMVTSKMEAAGFKQLYDCDTKEKEACKNIKKVFLLTRQSTSVEKWHDNITLGLEIMASLIHPLWTGMKSNLPDLFAMEEDKKKDKKEDIIEKIIRRKYVILEGVPGTGKTHIFKQIKKRPEISTRFLTFHPSSDYSSFIGGIRPGKDNGELIFNPTKGHLLKILEDAEEGPALLWIDELNRANVPRVFGDLISLIGNSNPPTLQILNAGLDDDKLELSDNQKKNLHIVATMNTSDRSVTPLDAALRRRFSFIRLKPMSKQELIDVDSTFSELEQHIDCFLELNEILTNSMGEDAVLGHSYLFEMLNDGEIRKQNELLMIWQFSILPNIVDTLMLTQNFEQVDVINNILSDSKIPLCLVNHGNGLGEMILIEVI
ncbi:MAG: AAA family ATPase [Candidatus Poseidoniales archaeon]|nr:MAG: AAA family ATPase [Candidatus Poseidoniales archaeon]